MREEPSIIKAINSLKSASFDDPISRIPNISEEMAKKLVEKGFATRTPWSKDPNISCYRLTGAAFEALNAKAAPRPKLSQLGSRLRTLPPRL